MYGAGKRQYLEERWYNLGREQALALNWIIQSLPDALLANAKDILTLAVK